MHAFLSNLANRQRDRQTDRHSKRIYLFFVGGKNTVTMKKLKRTQNDGWQSRTFEDMLVRYDTIYDRTILRAVKNLRVASLVYFAEPTTET